jgi:hypothetical protein
VLDGKYSLARPRNDEIAIVVLPYTAHCKKTHQVSKQALLNAVRKSTIIAVPSGFGGLSGGRMSLNVVMIGSSMQPGTWNANEELQPVVAYAECNKSPYFHSTGRREPRTAQVHRPYPARR